MSPATALAILLLKVTLLLLAGAGLAALLRRRAAAVRHDVWTATLTAAVALAVIGPLAPAIELAVAPAALELASAPATTVARELAAPAARNAAPPPVARSRPTEAAAVHQSPRTAPQGPAMGALALMLWAAGTAAVLLWCAVGHLGLRRLARAATPLDSPEWGTLLAETTALTGVTRPVRLRRSAAVGTPLTWGARRPTVLLPDDAERWPVERRRAALLHELAHVARHDYLSQLGGLAACALYWFHPAAWLALGRLRRESERACDDRVLAAGTPAAEYAAQLLEVARGANALRHGGVALAIGMARPSTLEGRLLAVLDERLPRRVVPLRARLAGAGILTALLVPLAGLTPVARATVEGPAAGPPQPPLAAMDLAPRGDGEGGATPPPGEAGSVVDRSVPASPGEELSLDLETGAGVEVRGWDEPRVEVHGQLGGRDWRNTRIDVHRASGGVVVHTFFAESRRSQSTSHHLQIRVPRRFDISVDSAGGGLAIDGVEGALSGTTGGGDLKLMRLRGKAELSTGGGTIRVSDSTLEGSVSTGGGLVTLSRVAGGLKGSSGSGPVVYVEPRDADADEPTGDLTGVKVDTHGAVELRGIDGEVPAATGTVHITRAGGDVRLAGAPDGAVISTGGGDVTVGASTGLVDAGTGGGDVTIGPVAGSVRASTGAGEVQVTLADAGGEGQTVEVKSGSGRVVIMLPADFDGAFELETAYTRSFGRETRITTPWALTRETTDWDDRQGTPRRYVR
ncbi:MAG TPA: M56 family metallopeptidase, partial [Thermoanaerobaculia bacterium]|nr:M56 family metallopeptidase [Thermoanaerobaculia bacterium]